MGKYDLNALISQLEKSESTGATQNNQSDFWKPTIEKGEERVEYTIRFLPNPDSENNFPWVKRDAHMFNFANGKFMYEPCKKRHTKGEKCYIYEEVDALYKSGDPSQEKIGGKRFAKKRFFHNVLIVTDPRDGGKNEGKVMVYECGQQIHEKCTEFLKNTELEASERIYFHPTVGTDFKLIIVRKSDYPNYEKSTFARKTSPITINGEELSLDEAEAFIEEKCIKLNERLLTDKAFKDYETLKSLYKNQGVASETTTTKPKEDEVETTEEVEETIDETIKKEKVEVRNPKEKVKPEPSKEETASKFLDDEEDDTDEDAELAALLAD